MFSRKTVDHWRDELVVPDLKRWIDALREQGQADLVKDFTLLTGTCVSGCPIERGQPATGRLAPTGAVGLPDVAPVEAVRHPVHPDVRRQRPRPPASYAG
ncbi:hypothetical protein ACIHDR_41185 [Nocardia sp. NPDC052278]|uniref:hypothetical protein n=1 Tax=unclassified Nocardia TaxID=2637762 RepID=UPI0036A27D8F